MNDYGNYQKNAEIGNTQQTGNQINSLEAETSKIESGRKYEMLKSSDDLKTSDATRTIFSTNSHSTLKNSLTLDELDVNINVLEHNSIIHDRTQLIAKENQILPNSTLASDLEEKQSDIQNNAIRKKVEDSINTESFPEDLNQLSKAQLENLLKNPNLTEDQIDEVYDRMDELEELELIEKKSSLEDINKVNNNLEKEVIKHQTFVSNKKQEINITGAAAIKEEKTLELAEKYIRAAVLLDNGNYLLSKVSEENRDSPLVHVHPLTNVLKSTKELEALLKNKIEGYENDDGEFEIREFEHKTLSKAEEAAFQEFIVANYPAQQQTKNTHEELEQPHASDPLPPKYKEEKIDNEQTPQKINGFRVDSASVDAASGKSTPEMYREKLEKLRKDIQKLEKEIKEHVLKHADLLREKQRNAQVQELVKTNYIVEDFAAENVEMENTYKELLKEVQKGYEELVNIVNDPKKTIEIPLATSKKIKSLDVNLHKVEKLVPKNIGGNDNFLLEVETFKKQIMGITLEMINSSNIHVTKGTDKTTMN